MRSWNDYVKDGTIRKTMPNKGRIKTLINMANVRIDVISKIKIDEQNASVIFTNYYDSLREICEAVALLNGYKIYFHEATGLFLKEILNEESFFARFDKYRTMRNGVHYYGTPVPFAESVQCINNMLEIIEKLKIKYLEEFI